MSSNKWTKPVSPPPPLFLGQKERDLVKQVNDELIEKVRNCIFNILEELDPVNPILKP